MHLPRFVLSKVRDAVQARARRVLQGEVSEAVVNAVDECAAMIDAFPMAAAEKSPSAADPLPSLFEQVQTLTAQLPASPEPIRTIHHFACTGGTLISKCLACMPNTQLLSEVEPFSRMQEKSLKGFHPTDLIQLVRHSSRGSDSQLEAAIFLAGLKALSSDCRHNGLRLVLRDHSHSNYCFGPAVPDTPSLRDLVKSAFPDQAIVTVRHPLDSFLSLEKLGWLHFEPATLEEYCNRYLRFLDDYEGIPLFRYEDFIAAPAAEMQAMCDALGLPYAEGFEQLFSVHLLSGDSGRSAEAIGSRARREVPVQVKTQVVDAASYEALCQRLAYSDNELVMNEEQSPKA